MFFDIVFRDGTSTVQRHGTPVPVVGREVHLSLRGKTLGTASLAGILVHEVPEFASEDVQAATLFVDDIFEASADSLLNPGVLVDFGYEIGTVIPKDWTVVLTKAYEA